MATRFPGFSAKSIRFLRELRKNNDRAWFAAHKEVFEVEVRQPMIKLIGVLSNELRRVAIDYVPERPEKAIYRIYRDTRFSHDKTPYKTHIAAMLQHRRVPKNRGAGFYFELSHEALGVAGGMYMPEPEQILAVRQALVERWAGFASLCQDRALVRSMGQLQGASLARVPKGFNPQSPAAEWLKRKQFYFYVELDPQAAMKPDLPKRLLGYFRLTLPMVEFLNNAVIGGLGDEAETLPVRPEPMF